MARRAHRDRPEVAAALRPHAARSADHRHEQDREAHAGAPEVPPRPRARRPAATCASAANAHYRAFTAADAAALLRIVRAVPAANGSGISDPWISRSAPRRTRSQPRSARGWRRTSSSRPVSRPRRRGRVGTRVAGEARRRPLGRHPLAGGVRRPGRVAGAGRDLQHGVRPQSRALQPVNRVGINLAGPTLLAHGTDEQKQRWLPAILDRGGDLVPAVQRARRGFRSRRRCRRAATPRRRRLAALGAEGVDVATRSSRAGGSAWPAPTPTCRSTRGSRTSSSTCRRPVSRCGRSCRSPATPSSTRCSSTRCSCPTTISSARCTTGGRSPTPRSRTSAARAFPFKEQVVHEVYLDELWQLAAATRCARRRRDRRRARAVVRRAARVAAAQLAHAVAARARASNRGPSRAS